MEVKVYVNDVEVTENAGGVEMIQKGTTESKFKVVKMVFGRHGDWATVSKRVLNGETRVRVQFSKEVDYDGDTYGFVKNGTHHYSIVVSNKDGDVYVEKGAELAFNALS